MNSTQQRIVTALAAVVMLSAGAGGQCEEGWDDRFGVPDIGFPLQSIVVTEEGGEPVLFGAGYWDGNPWWDRLGGLTNWDGVAWSVGTGGLSTRDPYFARFCADEATGLVYAYGRSYEYDGQSLGSLARWDGTEWVSLDAPFSVQLFQPGPAGDPDRVVIVGGRPESIAVREEGQWRTIATDIEWRDTRSILWADLGNGEQLHVFGRFEEIAGQPIAYAATWDGESWSAFGGGFESHVLRAVEFDLGWGPGVLIYGAYGEYSGWQFFDGTDWTVVSDEDLPDRYWLRGRYTFEGEDVLIFSTSPWEGGSTRLWTWNGNQWRQLPGEFDGRIADVGVYRFDGEPRLYAAGDFVAVDGEPRVSAAVFDGRRWRPMDNTDPGGSVREGGVLLDVGDEGGPMLGNKLYVGGALLKGWQDFGSVASWDGVRWESLGLRITGSSGFVTAMTIADLGEGPRLIVAGELWEHWGELLDLGQWDGTEWSSIGHFAEIYGAATALEVFDDGSGPMLYASGPLLLNNGASGGLVRFNSGQWEAFPSISPGRVKQIAVFDDGGGESLYAGGGAFLIDGEEVGPVIKWTQDGWVQVGNTLYNGDEIPLVNWIVSAWIDGKWTLAIQGLFDFDDGWYGNTQIAVLDDGVWKPDTDYFPHRAWTVRTTETPHGPVTLIDNWFRDGESISVYQDGTWRTLPGTFDGWVGDMTWSEVDGSPSVYAAGAFTEIDGVPSDGFARFGCARCLADFDADGDADAGDVAAFLDLWMVGDIATDINNDGYIDTRDVVEFLNVWNAGC